MRDLIFNLFSMRSVMALGHEVVTINTTDFGFDFRSKKLNILYSHVLALVSRQKCGVILFCFAFNVYSKTKDIDSCVVEYAPSLISPKQRNENNEWASILRQLRLHLTIGSTYLFMYNYFIY